MSCIIIENEWKLYEPHIKTNGWIEPKTTHQVGSNGITEFHEMCNYLESNAFGLKVIYNDFGVLTINYMINENIII
jgi:hypothetical protein